MRDYSTRFDRDSAYCALAADRSIDLMLEVGALVEPNGRKDDAYRPWALLRASRSGVKVSEPIADGDLGRAARAIMARLPAV